MIERSSEAPAWTQRRERGSAAAIKFIAWLALRIGRTATRPLLYPVCLYFVIFSTASGTASRAYLRRVLGHPPGFIDRFRHYHAFASCVLDRIYFLNDQIDIFDLRVENEDLANAEIARSKGGFLFGAHIGSFEVLRALGHRQAGLKLSLLMYEENARKIQSVLDAINPELALEVIALGHPDSMIAVEERLDQGHLIGILADRGILFRNDEHLTVEFLGENARFPLGPFRLAAILKRSVLLIIAVYRGGRRYDVCFERLADFTQTTRGARLEEIENALRLYVARLEHYCRLAPYNWFNFYDFWQ